MPYCESARCDCGSHSKSTGDGDSSGHSMVHSAIDFGTHPVELSLYLKYENNFKLAHFFFNLLGRKGKFHETYMLKA